METTGGPKPDHGWHGSNPKEVDPPRPNSSPMHFSALDFVVSEARRYKMRLILSLCNNWEDYGGKAQYVRWGKEAGVDLTSDDDFFSDPTLKGYYKAFVEFQYCAYGSVKLSCTQCTTIYWALGRVEWLEEAAFYGSSSLKVQNTLTMVM
ncbi:hypothetical protein ZWY2020_015734 [Hordeum vulgare]|nr:hypothetical protein ZWY2020_015734 [Hordeum vulgare]